MRLPTAIKIPKFVKLLIFGLIIVGFLSRLLGAFIDPDMWWHIKLGGDILNGQWVNTLTFTCTDYIWINHSWLSDVLIYQINTLLGFQGLAIFFALIFAGGILFSLLSLKLVLKQYKIKNSVLSTLLYIAFFTLLLSSFIAIRPQVFTFLFFNALIFFLLKLYYAKSVRFISLIPLSLFFILWVNLHGGFVIGIVLTGIFITAIFFEFLFKLFNRQQEDAKLHLSKIKYLFVFIIVFLVSSLINPFGLDLWKEIFTLVLGSNNANFITEWKSINIKDSYGLFYFMLFVGTLLLQIVNKSSNLLRLLMVVGLGLLSLYSIRYILPVSGIVLLVLFIEANILFEWLLNKILTKDRDILRLLSILKYVLIITIALVSIMSGYIGISFFTSLNNTNEAADLLYPTKAKDFLEQNKKEYSSLRFYNTYVWGGYLEYTLPDYKWIIDGRMPEWHCKGAVRSSIMLDYIEVEDLGSNWNLVLEKQNVNGLIIKTNSILYNVINTSSNWNKVYTDETATIFIRN